MIASLSDSSIKQYSPGLKQWWQFCAERKLNPFEIKVDKVLKFLSIRFKDGATCGTLNTIRSAISLISDKGLEDNSLIKRFFGGVYKLRPSGTKYNVTWDVNIILDYVLETLFPLSQK